MAWFGKNMLQKSQILKKLRNLLCPAHYEHYLELIPIMPSETAFNHIDLPLFLKIILVCQLIIYLK